MYQSICRVKIQISSFLGIEMKYFERYCMSAFEYNVHYEKPYKINRFLKMSLILYSAFYVIIERS